MSDDESNENEARLLLLRKSDGALLRFGPTLHMAASSGLTGGAGEAKRLRVVFEGDEADACHRLSKQHGLGSPASSPHHAAASRIVAKQRCKLVGETSIAVNYVLPLRAPSAVPAADGSGSSSAHAKPTAVPHGEPHLTAMAYGTPCLESVELRTLPISEYWDVEELLPTWWVGTGVEPSQAPNTLTARGGVKEMVGARARLEVALASAVKRSGVTSLAALWSDDAVLDCLLQLYDQRVRAMLAFAGGAGLRRRTGWRVLDDELPQARLVD